MEKEMYLTVPQFQLKVNYMNLPYAPTFSLNGKQALVIGASSGIGQGCALALAESGAHVICAARNQSQLETTVSTIVERGGSAEALSIDVTELGKLESALNNIEKLDIVVNSAGIARHALAIDTTAEDYDAIMETNLKSAYFLSVYAANVMRNQGGDNDKKGGSIIHIGSQMGHVGGAERTVYCASKHGLEGMVKAMAIEWGQDNIRVNTICPTFIDTPLVIDTVNDPEKRRWIEGNIKLNRLGKVEDVMGAVIYLASDAATLITGTSLLIDGGWTAS